MAAYEVPMYCTDPTCEMFAERQLKDAEYDCGALFTEDDPECSGCGGPLSEDCPEEED